MTHDPTPFDRPALLLSLALHVAAALVCAIAFANGSFALGARDSSDERDEPTAIVRIVTPPPTRAPVVAAATMVPLATPRPIAAARPAVLPPMPHPHANVYVVHAHDAVVVAAAVGKRVDVAPSAGPLRIAFVSGTDPAPSSAPVAVSTTEPTPTPTPAPAVTPAEQPTLGPNGPGVYGQNRRADLANGLTTADLAAVAGGSFHVRITVDENGRARDVVFLTTPRNADDLRRRLLAARYLPAECDGLYCEGTIDLRG